MELLKTSLYGADSALRREFQFYERDIRIQNYRLCSGLASFFMVAGCSLDLIVYKLDGLLAFLPLRIMSAFVLLIMGFLLGTKLGREWHRTIGICMSLPLMGSIGWMIYAKEGNASPYYAGLNLVMLGAAILMRWPLFESVLVVLLTIIIYFAACFLHGPVSNLSIFFNNCYFLFVTGVFTVAGTWFYNNIRFNEFLLRRTLDLKHDEVLHTNQKLEESNQKLRELDEAKSRFFANISHELRTPLTLLIAPVETMLHKGEAMPHEQRHELLSTMQANAMRLLKLINTILELVRLDTKAAVVKKAPVIMADFVQGMGKACKSLAQDKRIQLQVQCSDDVGCVMADVEKLERICLNLLFNALKFTPAGGTIWFSTAKDSGSIVISVRDTGVGISDENLKHLFSRFWQADASSQRRFLGLGLGLALVKELAEAHGGSVDVQSTLGKGATFTVRLPHEPVSPTQTSDKEKLVDTDQEPSTGEWIADLYRRAEFSGSVAQVQGRRPTQHSQPKLALPSRSFNREEAKTPMRLLIAEDEHDMMSYLRNQLSQDFEIIEAADGNEAVTKACQYLPDVILSDLMMPYKDGMQVCRELRQHNPTRNIPIVLLTARPDERTKLEALLAGATDFVGKPFSLTEVRVRLQNLAKSFCYQKELLVQKNQLASALEQLKESEALLVQHEKLSSLGRLSAGLIHEINNPLNYAVQGLGFLRQQMGDVSESAREVFVETLGDIQTGVDRVATIITDLRGFTRSDDTAFADFPAAGLVQTVMRFFSQQTMDVKVSVNVPEGILIHGNQNQLTQVLVNLVQNALDAMEEKAYPEGQERSLSLSASAEAKRVFLRVRDNGSGMTPDVQARVFDPFFTTKDVGKGMGLGLAICHRIVADHQGRVLVESTPNEGTEFILDLPQADSYVADPFQTDASE